MYDLAHHGVSQAADVDDDAALAALQQRAERVASSKPKARHIRGKHTSKREARTTAEIMAAVESHRQAADADDDDVKPDVKEEAKVKVEGADAAKKGVLVAGQRVFGATKVRLPDCKTLFAPSAACVSSRSALRFERVCVCALCVGTGVFRRVLISVRWPSPNRIC